MFCPECGTKVEEDAKFCPKCGFNLNKSEQNNTSNSAINIGNKSKGIPSFLDDWNEWSTGKKIGSIILVCCVGLIIIGAIGGILFPDLNTSEHRFYMTNSSFVIPDGCTIRESGIGPAMAILVQKNGSEVFVNDNFPQRFDSSHIIDSNETLNVDGVNVYKIKYHTSGGTSFTDYFFNKDNIDYCIVFNQQTQPNDDLVTSIVKSMDTTHGSANDHENVYSNSNSNNSGKANRYDSYTGGSSSKANHVEVDKKVLSEQEYSMFAYDHTKDYTLNGKKGHLYVGPYHNGGSDVEFYYKDSGTYFCLSACDDADAALENMATMV